MLLDNVSDLIERTDECARPISTAGPAAASATQLELPADEVHVWLANLDAFGPESLRSLLAEDELARADRFHFDKDRNHFIVARGLLRRLLTSYLGSNAAELKFEYGRMGKPSLTAEQSDWLTFNLAHSNGFALYAVTRQRAVGVDLEFMRDDVAEEQLAERFFSPGEARRLRSLPVELRRQGFFNCWTRKEAYIKARGEGLSMPLSEFEVSFAASEAAALLGNQVEPEEVKRWSMKAIDVPSGYVGAVVAAGQNWRLKEFVLS
ncbi:MAG TPA: 4'-phosphopantetheinyl transferase superfamily protein [Pyrinomonadaceae bacterium]|nr:4'-phosphopantetheinyl transferase superfamily protein [Pyrinomonadaceae bacterium]